MVVELADGIYWVGAVDWGLRHFHGFELSTHRGSSYNAYLIRDARTALVDTVWGPFTDELLANVREVVPWEEIDYVIANHAEPDHSGALPEVMRRARRARLIVSKRGADSIPGHYHQNWDMQAVGTGDTLDLGDRKLTFVEAPMLHWPDSMFTYVAGDGIWLSNDAFGQHYATAFRFNDQVDQDELYQEALKYYANILTPFSKLVTKKIEEIVALKLPLNMIAPSHGVIWRHKPIQIVEKYLEWAAQVPEKRAVILYDTMWHATRRMAEAIGAGLADAGVDHKLLHMAVTDRNDAIVEIFRSRAVVVGSPTLNNGLLPTIAPILEDLKGLRFADKIGLAFGSFGWSGESVRLIEEHFAKCKIPVIEPGIQAKWQPSEEDLARCRQIGMRVAQAIGRPE